MKRRASMHAVCQRRSARFWAVLQNRDCKFCVSVGGGATGSHQISAVTSSCTATYHGVELGSLDGLRLRMHLKRPEVAQRALPG